MPSRPWPPRPPRALATLSDGSALADEAYADWAEPARTEAGALLREARQAAAAAALDLGDPATARALAEAAVATDPYDEAGYRLLMRAETAFGRPARALAEYERLRARLATDFGVDPAPETRAVHLAILQEQPATQPSTRRRRLGRDSAGSLAEPGTPAPRSGLVGRDAELIRLSAAWTRAAAGEPGLLLITGEAGIGKTRLAAELTGLALETGGTVLSARCYEAERSLFLQPLVEALGQHAARSRAGPDPGGRRRLGRSAERSRPGDRRAARAGAWSAAARRPNTPGRRSRGAGRTTPSAGTCTASPTAPVLLLLDDLHNAGPGHRGVAALPGPAGPRRAAARGRDGPRRGGAAALTRAGRCRPTGSTSARCRRRRSPGWPPRPATPSSRRASCARTRGHTLFVVETLRGLAVGEPGIPESLPAAVLTRVGRSAGGVAGTCCARRPCSAP